MSDTGIKPELYCFLIDKPLFYLLAVFLLAHHKTTPNDFYSICLLRVLYLFSLYCYVKITTNLVA